MVLYRFLSLKPEIIPLFKMGESGLVFVSPETPEPVPEPENSPRKVEPEPDSFPEPEAPKEVVTPIHSQSPVAPVETVPQHKPGNEGDSADKGAETSYVGLTEIWPKYPLGARLRGEEGVVSVKARVNEKGRAEHVEVVKSSGYKALDNAAEEAVKKATFVARDKSSPAGAEFTLAIRFKLRD